MKQRESVTVDGIVLSRDQIERAVEELKKPLYPQVRHGLMVRSRNSTRRGVVIGGWVQSCYRKGADASGDITVVNLDGSYGSASTFLSENLLWRFYEPVDA